MPRPSVVDGSYLPLLSTPPHAGEQRVQHATKHSPAPHCEEPGRRGGREKGKRGGGREGVRGREGGRKEGKEGGRGGGRGGEGRKEGGERR